MPRVIITERDREIIDAIRAKVLAEYDRLESGIKDIYPPKDSIDRFSFPYIVATIRSSWLTAEDLEREAGKIAEIIIRKGIEDLNRQGVSYPPQHSTVFWAAYIVRVEEHEVIRPLVLEIVRPFFPEGSNTYTIAMVVDHLVPSVPSLLHNNDAFRYDMINNVVMHITTIDHEHKKENMRTWELLWGVRDRYRPDLGFKL